MQCMIFAACLVVFFLQNLVSPAQAQSSMGDVSYARLQQKSVHNAYQRKESLLDMLRFHSIRSLELDIHAHKPFHKAEDGDWFVYHHAFDTGSKVEKLSDGLSDIRRYHDENPEHEVITLWLDVKEPFDGGSHNPQSLDSLFERYFADALWSPEDLLARCPSAETLQNAVAGPACTWPTFDDLRGRVLIVLTESPNLAYIENGKSGFQRKAFIAPKISEAGSIAEMPFAVFFNIEFGKVKSSDLTQKIREQGLVSRTWDLNSSKDWTEAVKRGVHHLATNKVNQAKDPWSTTKQGDGSLFAIIPGE